MRVVTVIVILAAGLLAATSSPPARAQGPRPALSTAQSKGDAADGTEPKRKAKKNDRRPSPERRHVPRPIPESVHAELNVSYAGTNNPRQKLDIYLPDPPNSAGPLPVVVFIHGGAFLAGNKRNGWPIIADLVTSGDFAAVSIGYRLTGEAIWPAQIHDCKAAIRWIRANAKKYNIDPDRIGVMGNSAGGHLAAMLGTSGDVPALEGKVGEHTNVSSRVACVVDRFGPTDLLSLYGGKNVPNAPEAKLVGGPLQEHKETARSASPTTYASEDDPPFLLLHGTEDATVRFDQSERLASVLKRVGATAYLVPIVGAGHGDFRAPEVPRRIRQFLDKYLRSQDITLSEEPIVAKKQDTKPES